MIRGCRGGRVMRMARWPARLGLAALLGGCQSAVTPAYRFPSVWPGSQPLSEDAPTVSVEPLQVNVAQAIQLPEGDPGVPTAAVLSVLLVKHLHVNGINAVLEQATDATAQYILSCSVPELGYGEREGFPKERRYRAELLCTLKDGQTQDVLWTRRLKQDYDQTVLLDLLSNLPEEPHKHDRILFRECIVPLWDTMAASVGAVVASRKPPTTPAAANATP